MKWSCRNARAGKKKKVKKMVEQQQVIHVKAICHSSEDAERLAKKHGTMPGITGVKIVGNMITFICVVAKRAALSLYGKIKDMLPSYCRCTCTPIYG